MLKGDVADQASQHALGVAWATSEALFDKHKRHVSLLALVSHPS